MTRKAAAVCSKCGKPINKGQCVMQETWATAGDVVDGRRQLLPYFGVVLHVRCLPEWTRERKALRGLLP